MKVLVELEKCTSESEMIHAISGKISCTDPYICSAQSENLDNSGIALRKVGIPKLADRVRILTSRDTIPELSVRKVRIGTKCESYIRNKFYG